MDSTISSCCIEDPSTKPEKPPPVTESLQRVGSGASVVIDPETGIEAESRKLTSSQYKGVVPQPNGRWGAQIYEKHQRVWLGTFNEEADGARAYDVAAQRFRGRDAVTNFKPLSESNEDDVAELDFLNCHTKAEIVDMLRKHTYDDELQQSKRAFGSAINTTTFGGKATVGTIARGAREHLFYKTVTPSDVGKLNRLVIPKQHAEKNFPLQINSSSTANNCKGLLLNFEDAAGKVWRFRYSYWNSSQSYVLTKGWSRFVKEKGLKAGDVVSFQQSKCGEKKLYIDWKPRATPIQVVRLFGVNIFQVDSHGNESGKRRGGDRDMELIASPQFLKKQCVGVL